MSIQKLMLAIGFLDSRRAAMEQSG